VLSLYLHEFSWFPFHVAESIRKITSNTTVLNGIPLVLIKLLLPLVLPVLTQMFVLSFLRLHSSLCGKFPVSSQTPKVNSPTKISDYYPISTYKYNCNFSLKILQISHHCFCIEILNKEMKWNEMKFSFCLLGTLWLSRWLITSLVIISFFWWYICLNLELNQPTILDLFDFSKVFDSVGILWNVHL
jgi:hypothetical protein